MRSVVLLLQKMVQEQLIKQLQAVEQEVRVRAQTRMQWEQEVRWGRMELHLGSEKQLQRSEKEGQDTLVLEEPVLLEKEADGILRPLAVGSVKQRTRSASNGNSKSPEKPSQQSELLGLVPESGLTFLPHCLASTLTQSSG